MFNLSSGVFIFLPPVKWALTEWKSLFFPYSFCNGPGDISPQQQILFHLGSVPFDFPIHTLVCHMLNFFKILQPETSKSFILSILSLFNHPKIISKYCKLRISTICNFLLSSVTYFSGSNILISILCKKDCVFAHSVEGGYSKHTMNNSVSICSHVRRNVMAGTRS